MTRLKKLIFLSGLTALFVAGAGYWYVFIAGVPQLDAPQVEVVKD